MSCKVTVEYAFKSPEEFISGKPYTNLIFKKLPILNADATLFFDCVVLALSNVMNEGTCLSTSYPLTYALPEETTPINLLLSPAE